ncbi:MAG: hypothetical protein COB85_07185 [Bacteroidetes bacterium]|nr:MAG: hypothetical protein COB85_07185 [Bacteroidota bacterium]
MRIKRALKIFLILAGIMTNLYGYSQDSHLSQFFGTHLTLNPALTGMFKGNYRVHLQYRNQWKSVISKPFETTNLTYDQPLKRFGIGAYILNYRAGISGINVFNFLLSGAYEITIDHQNEHHLTTGLQLGIIHKSFDPSALTFDNQYDSSYASGTFDPGISSGETFEKTSILLPEVNFGVYYYNERKNATFNPYLGVSGFHLTQPTESFYGQKNKLPMRLVVHGGTKIKINNNYSAEPNFLYMRQTNDNEFQFGTLIYYHLSGYDANIFIGPYYRNKDAVIIHVGGLYQDFRIGISYDINTSSLKGASNGRGGIEFSITYTKQKAKYLPSIL